MGASRGVAETEQQKSVEVARAVTFVVSTGAAMVWGAAERC
jgi:hypothetical protein